MPNKKVWNNLLIDFLHIEVQLYQQKTRWLSRQGPEFFVQTQSTKLPSITELDMKPFWTYFALVKSEAWKIKNLP